MNLSSEIWIAVGLAAAALLAWFFWGARSKGTNIPVSTAGRTAQVGVLGSKVSLRYYWAKLRGLFASEERKKVILDESHLKSAEQVVKLMGNMKGAVMKLGQIVSFISDDVPGPYQKVLQQLQMNAPPMGFDLTKKVIEEELGGPLKDFYSDMDETPLAAASIGQVHRARLKGGQEVCVKVQYPGVDKAIEADLVNVGWMYGFLGMMNPGLDPKPLAEELKLRLREELDYENEARNQQHFVDLYGGHPFIRIPKVYPQLSKKRILTQEFIKGHDFNWMLSQSQEAKNRVAEILYRFVFGSIVRFHVFNGDPHPGNYLFHEDGTVTFLDFGCVKYFKDPLLDDWRDLITSHFSADLNLFMEKAVKIGFLKQDTKVSKQGLYDYFGYFYEPFRYDRQFTFTSEYNAQSLKIVFDKSHPQYGPLIDEFNMPGDFLLLNRLQWGVYSILAKLAATGNWCHIHREYYFGDPPSTLLGKESAGFRSQWKKAHEIPENFRVWMEPGGLKWGE